MHYTRTLLILCIFYCVNCATSDKFDNTPDGNNGIEKNYTTLNQQKYKAVQQDEHNKSLTTIAEGVKIPSDELLTSLKGKLPVERNAQPSVVARKGVKSSISARKGVEPPSDAEILNTTKAEVSKNVQSTTERTAEVDLTKPSSRNATKSKPEKSKLAKKFKPKPTVTVAGAGDVPRPNLGVPTKTPPLGMSSKINYVVPVIVTILVLPLFVVFVIFLYRNGRECWDKRHYRRMDFLIDGMYNE